MDSLPTGSKKLLEIRTSELNMVIKTKKTWDSISMPQSSLLHISGKNIEMINIEAIEKKEHYQQVAEIASYEYQIPPIFFEQTDYEIVITSVKGKSVSFWNENYAIREKIGSVIEGDNSLITGVINFDNFAGYSDLEILLDGERHLLVRIEIFPSKISYKEDYQKMINDISEMICSAAIDFMQKTYQIFSVGDTTNSVLAIYFQILKMIFDEYMRALNRIIEVPHHKLVKEYSVLPQYKVKRTDRKTEKWLMNHSDYVSIRDGKILAEKLLGVKKQITYDTNENRFVKYILKSTVQTLKEFLRRYQKSINVNEERVVSEANAMIRDIQRVLNKSMFKEVSDYTANQSMSLVFGMAAGYRELYKCYIMLQHGLNVNGDIFKISVKDTAQLYEYWCFVKLFSLLKKEYQLISPDIIKVDQSGITVTLKKGATSKVRFINPKTKEIISLVYNPQESKTQTVNQRPDNVLELEKKGTEVSYKYVFDAKYRIEQNLPNKFYPDVNPGPKVDDINTMHRYRDSIVYENKESKFTFEKTMFGAYILFPYDDEEKYKEHRFYKSIDTVNIGGLPFLPSATQLVEKLLSELIADSKESAFERTTLPSGIEEKLAKVDWNKRDVLIGTFRNKEQFNYCYDHRIYYIPVSKISDSKLPIHWVALYQTDIKFDGKGEIRYYGEVLRMEKMEAKQLNSLFETKIEKDESYYVLYIREWKDITKNNLTHQVIKPKESGFLVDYTNMFLLENSENVQELLLKSEEEYRLYSELKRMADHTEIENKDQEVKFESDDCTVLFSEGEILVMKDDSIVGQTTVSDFSKKPAQTFRMLQYTMRNI